MRANSAPRIATWLLRRLGSGPHTDATIGDLIERYHAGHGRFWYWRQVTLSVAASTFAEIRNHKLLAVRGIVTGMVVGEVLARVLIRLYAYLHPDRYTLWLISRRLPWPQDDWLIYEPYFQYLETFYAYGVPYVPYLIILLIGIASGWSIARFHRPDQTAMVLLFCLIAVLNFLVGFLSLTPTLIAAGNFYSEAGSICLQTAIAVLGILAGGLRRKPDAIVASV